MLLSCTKAAIFARKIDVLTDPSVRLNSVLDEISEDIEEVDLDRASDHDFTSRDEILFRSGETCILKFADQSGFLWHPSDCGDRLERGYYGIMPYATTFDGIEAECQIVRNGAGFDAWSKHQYDYVR